MINKTKYLRENQESMKKKFPAIDEERKVEILCPFSRKVLNSSNCFKCKYCQIYQGKHQSNRVLISLICLFSYNIGSGDDES